MGSAGTAARGTTIRTCCPPVGGHGLGFDPQTRAAATVRYSARAWGTELVVHVTGIPPGTSCQFWVTSTTGQDIPAGAWAIAPGQRHAWYPASAPVPVPSLRSFEVTTAGKTLVTVLTHRASAPPRSQGLTLNPKPAPGGRR